MLWVLIDSGLLWICFILVTREDRRRRDAIRSDPASAAHARFGTTEGDA
jgi:hypothetical protein